MNTNYDIIVVLTSDMLEDGMVLRGTNGEEYTIAVEHLPYGQTRVEVPWGHITYTDNSVGCNFLTTYESSADFGLESPARWFMFGADEMGSIAEMPIVAPSEGTAREMALLWLDQYDHGFDHAILVGLDVQHAWQGETVPVLHERICSGRMSKQLI